MYTEAYTYFSCLGQSKGLRLQCNPHASYTEADALGKGLYLLLRSPPDFTIPFSPAECIPGMMPFNLNSGGTLRH